MSKNSYIWLIACISLVILSSSLTYSITKLKLSSNSKPSSLQNIAPSTNPIFSQQTATVLGKITSATDKSITITDANGHISTFPINNQFIIHRLPNSPAALSLSDPRTIEATQEAVTRLQVIGNQYYAVSVDYIPPDAIQYFSNNVPTKP